MMRSIVVLPLLRGYLTEPALRLQQHRKVMFSSTLVLPNLLLTPIYTGSLLRRSELAGGA